MKNNNKGYPVILTQNWVDNSYKLHKDMSGLAEGEIVYVYKRVFLEVQQHPVYVPNNAQLISFYLSAGPKVDIGRKIK